MSGKLTLVPVGGLCNRMRVIDSAFSLFKDKTTRVEIIWFKDWGMGCDFKALFDPITEFPNIFIKDAAISDYFLYDRPRNKNFRFPLLFQKFYFNKRIPEKEVFYQLKGGYDFSAIKESEKVYCASYLRLHPGDNRYKLFIPNHESRHRIETLTSLFHADTIGIHIRRSDNEQSIRFSPTELFVQRIGQEIKQNENVTFFLASDSEKVKDQFRELFGERIICTSDILARNSEEGIKNALVELYALSRTNKIIGSSSSSYSATAAEISGIPLEIVGEVIHHEFV
ncbi:MAG: glycosyl transferase [Candidatus Azobacteroides sp.]|nr:glycosyl transferase [Candidatus Azobacteroides sp.]